MARFETQLSFEAAEAFDSAFLGFVSDMCASRDLATVIHCYPERDGSRRVVEMDDAVLLATFARRWWDDRAA